MHAGRKSWDELYLDLVDFHRVNGHANVPSQYQSSNTLARWVSKQRMAGTRGDLSSERRTKLDRLGLNWETSKERDNRVWNELFERLVAYKRRKGNCLVPKYYSIDRKLGGWVSRQRTFYKRGALRQDRLERLENIGFNWIAVPHLVWSADRDVSSLDSLWDAHYVKLQNFFEEHGHSLVPHTYINGEVDPLAKWIQVQRRENALELIRPDRKKRLQELDFVWRVDIADSEKSLNQKRWNELYERLVAFHGEFGHCMVSQNYDHELGQWVRNQRRTWVQGKLDKRREDDLNAIKPDFFTDFYSLEAQWKGMFDKLERFRDRHGTSCVSQSQDPKLYEWVREQRRALRNKKMTYKKMTSNRRKLLDSIDFEWERPSGGTSVLRTKRKNAEAFDSSGAEWSHADVDEGLQLKSDDDEDERKPAAKRQKPTGSMDGDGDTASVEVGSRVAVFWKSEGVYFYSTVLQQRRDKSLWLLNYDDGDSQWTDLSKQQWHLLEALDTSILHSVGTKVKKYFPGHGWFEGKIYRQKAHHYKVKYEDGDKERYKLDSVELHAMVQRAGRGK